jgi:hypothetical protein
MSLTECNSGTTQKSPILILYHDCAQNYETYIQQQPQMIEALRYKPEGRGFDFL